MGKITEAKIVIEFEDGLEFNTDSTFSEALTSILSLLENEKNYYMKIRVKSEDGKKTKYVNKIDKAEEEEEEEEED